MFGNRENTQVLYFENKKARTESVVDAIVRSHNVMVVCGPGTLVSSGIQVSQPLSRDVLVHLIAYNSPLLSQPEKSQIRLVRGGTEAQTTLSTLLNECSSISSTGNELREDTLGLFNIIMTRRRLQARTAPANQFHAYLRRLCESNNLVQCLTTNLDGIEVRDIPDIKQKIVMMRGDNRVVRCLTKDCPGYTASALDGLTEQLLKGDTVPCEHCTSRGEPLNWDFIDWIR
jgi:hypothetical protein